MTKKKITAATLRKKCKEEFVRRGHDGQTDGIKHGEAYNFLGDLLADDQPDDGVMLGEEETKIKEKIRAVKIERLRRSLGIDVGGGCGGRHVSLSQLVTVHGIPV